MLGLARRPPGRCPWATGAAFATKCTIGRTSMPGPNLTLRRANEIVCVYDDNVARLVGTNAGQPSEVKLAS